MTGYHYHPPDWTRDLRLPFLDLREELFQREIKARANETNRRIRVLLGAWVSETEPEILIGPDGMPQGITRAGGGRLIMLGDLE